MNNSSQNFVDHVPCPYAVSVFFTTILAVTSLAAVIGNLLVFVAVYKTPILRTSTNYYYVNMAVSDFLSSIATWPLYLTDEIITSRGSLIQGSLATAGCKVGLLMRNISYSVSILSLGLIAVDRFIATVYPLKVTLLTKNIRASLLLSTWLFSIGCCFPSFLYSSVETIGHESFCRLVLNATGTIIYYIFCLLMLITSYSAITILYLRIMLALRRRLQPEHGTEDINAEHKRSKNNQNAMKIFKSIVVAFFICWFPFGIYLILKIVVPELFVRDKCKFILGFSYFVFPTLTAVINPMILFSFSSNFRHALKDMCLFSLRKCKSCWEGENVSPFPVNEQQPEVQTYQMGECV